MAGFGWNTSNQQANPVQGSAWGSTGNQSGGTNPFGSGFQAPSQGQASGQPAFGQAQQASNPFGGGTQQPAGQRNPFQQTGGFGQQSAPGGFGQQQQSTGGAFGQQQQQSTGNAFGQQQNTAQQPSSGFGFGTQNTAPASNPFGQATDTQNRPSGGFGFGSQSTTQSSNPFGQQSSTQTQPSGGFGSFGAQRNTTQPTLQSFGFGQSTQSSNAFGQAQKPAFGFGGSQSNAPASASTNTFGTQFGANSNRPASGFGFGSHNQNTTQPSGGFGFGSQQSATQQPQQQTNAFGQQQSTGFGFGTKPATGGFGQPTTNQSTTTGGFGFSTPPGNQSSGQANPFGAQTTTAPKPGGLFGSTSTAPNAFGSQQSTGFQFGAPNQNQTGGNAFQQQQPATTAPGQFGFGAQTTQTRPSGGLFGQTTTTTTQPAPAGQAKPFGFGGSTGFGAPAGSSAPAPTTNAFGTGGTGFGSTGFGAASTAPATGQAKPFSFGSTTTTGTAAPAASNAFGAPQTTTGFGSSQPTATTNVFGSQTAGQQGTAPFGLGSAPAAQPAQSTASTPFQVTGTAAQPTTGGIFGTSTQQPAATTAPALGAEATDTKPLSLTTGTTAAKTEAQPATSGLFALDPNADLNAIDQAMRAEFTFIPIEEFERFHPLMRELLQLDSRHRPSHPTYPARKLLLDPCDATKREQIEKALDDPNAAVADAVDPDEVRTSWTETVKTVVKRDQRLCPVPCASMYALSKRVEDAKTRMEAQASKMRAAIASLAEAQRQQKVQEQWIDEEGTAAFQELHRSALGVLRDLMAVKERDGPLTAHEEKLTSSVREVRAVLRGDIESAAMQRICPSPKLYEVLCGKKSIEDVLTSCEKEIESAEKAPEKMVSDLEKLDDRMIEGVLDKLDELRGGTKALLAKVESRNASAAGAEKSSSDDAGW